MADDTTKISTLPLSENLDDDDLLLVVEDGVSKKAEVGYLKEVFDGGSDVSITPSLGSGTKVADYEIDGVAGAIYVPTAPTALSQLNDDSTHRVVTDTEKSIWNGKQDTLTFDNAPTSGSSNPVKSGGVYTALAEKANSSDVPALDSTLSLTNAAAQAKAVGDALDVINEKINGFDEVLNGIEVPIFSNPFGLKLYDVGGKYKVNKRYADFYSDALNGIEWVSVYCDPISGNDNNDGTKEHPVKTISKALTFSGTSIRVVMPSGEFTAFNSGFYGTIITDVSKNVMIECEDGIYKQRYGMSASARTWSETGSGVWQNNISAAPINVIKGTTYYTKVASAADCASTPESFAHVSGVLYVHVSDGTKPTDQFLEFAPAAVKIPAQSNSSVLIVKNICFSDGTFSNPSNKGIVQLESDSSNTSFKMFFDNLGCGQLRVYGYHQYYFNNVIVDGDPLSDANGIAVNKSSITWLEKCLVKNIGADGYNYHNVGSSGNPFVVELECAGLNCGMSRSATINNCSTLHENFKAIRIGGVYYNSKDRVIHDINNSLSFNAFCKVSQTEDGANETIDFAVGGSQSDAAEMYIYQCDVSGSNSTYNIGVYSGTSNVLKTWGTRLDRIKTSEQIDTKWNPYV